MQQPHFVVSRSRKDCTSKTTVPTRTTSPQGQDSHSTSVAQNHVRALLSRHAEQVLAKLKVPADETFGLTVAWLDSETGDGALTVEDLLLAVAESPATRAWVADFTW